MAILHVVETLHPYLTGRHFHIKTNHHSLMYFLEQRLSSPKNHKWVTNILGYDYETIYNKGKENVVNDALSRKFEEDVSLFSLALPILGWLKEYHWERLENSTTVQLI